MVKIWSSGLIQKLLLQAATNKAVLVGVQAGSPKRKKAITITRNVKGDIKKTRKKSKQEDTATNAEIAFYNEFGAINRNIPARPFIRTALFDNQQKYKNMNLKGAKAIIDGNLTIDMHLERLGVTAQNDIKRKITLIVNPANAASTIAKKNSSKPLIDTGQMRNSITYRVGTIKELGGGNV